MRLEPGESRELTFRLAADQLAHWDVAIGDFTVDPGRYEIVAARSAGNTALTAELTATGPAPAPRRVVDQRVLAADFDDYTGITLVDATQIAGDAIMSTHPAHPATVLFRSADLSGAVRIEAEVALANHDSPDARLEFRAGDRLLAQIAVPDTGSKYMWTTVAAEVPAPVEGVHDLSLVLQGGVRLAAFRFGSSR